MRTFPTLQEFSDEEKTFGGVISFRQFAYLFASSVAGGLFSVMLWSAGVPGWAALLPALVLAGTGAALAFLAFDGLGLHRWIYLYLRYRRRPRVYVLRLED
ncbi:MAG: PrgI family protein [Firmicutes bacterium]|nr:PrgI family protein [Bacillota bacterium]